MKAAREKNTLRVRRAPLIETEITVPGDKSISHRAVILSAISNGPCVITNFLEGEDCRSTAKAMAQLGVHIEFPEPGTVIVEGGRGKFSAPDGDLDCGNSGTTMRLMAGLLSAQVFRSRMTGDPSLSKRPMRRVIDPLTQMGARLSAEGEKQCPPLVVEGGPLKGIEYRLPVASAQVKSAVLLAGLFAEGRTTVIENVRSRDHTERMLEYYLVPLKRQEIWEGGPSIATRRLKEIHVTVEGGRTPESRDFRVPGDISSAAFWLVAAAAQPGSRLLVKNVGLNPTRTGIIDVLVRMGARIREVVETADHGEPSGTIDIKGGHLQATVIEGDEIPNVIDEIPAIAVAAALAEGTTIIRNASELRVKETDRIAAVASNLRAFGVEVEEFPDGMAITGGKPLKGARVPSFGDHRIAMAFAVAGLFATRETVIEDTACVQTSYPTFAETLRKILKGTGVGRRTPVISSLETRPRRRKKARS
ncbi:MAG: 3-phosphoshikimate 1-carboxyvinyltransferase [Terrimicrobiaceae bacterium]|nr:3-phosphoshikimate 1-carboxyvinyltransferase [Terrimicrobiaceae bacterium]